MCILTVIDKLSLVLESLLECNIVVQFVFMGQSKLKNFENAPTSCKHLNTLVRNMWSFNFFSYAINYYLVSCTCKLQI
jgi:hypothetical protein